MEYLKGGLGTSGSYNEAKEMSRSLVPRSERRDLALGNLAASLQTSVGLCGKPRPGKGGCWRKAGHEGECP